MTADHSTPVPQGALVAPGAGAAVGARAGLPRRRDDVLGAACIAGALGRMPLRYLIAEAMACAGKVAKFGA